MITKSWTEGLTGGGSRSPEALTIRARAASEVFYDGRSVTPQPGDDCDQCDMVCDGEVNSFDIEPFLTCLFP